MKQLHISLVQADLAWESPAENFRRLDTLLIDGISSVTDLIILPEMFSTGFSMSPAALAEPMNGPSVQWMQEKAQTYDAVVTGSLIIKASGRYYNRLLWVEPRGTVQYYDKRHLFTLAGEEKVYEAGQKQLIVTHEGWRIMPLICYDLRFPVWSRNTSQYDLLLYVANFPDKRSFAWRQLLIARAIENQCYTIGLNRVGTDGNGIYYGGNSCVLDYTGHYLTHLPPRSMVKQVVIKRAAQQTFREKLAFLPDQDRFEIR